MKITETCRLELVPIRRIKRMPALGIDVSPNKVGKIRDFTRERGHCLPVILSESDGCMTLLSNAAAFEVCLEEKGGMVPAVIIQTEGEADNLIFALQSAALNESPDTMAVSAAIVQLIDVYGISRKRITESLGKSPTWVNRMENLCRKLNQTVQQLVMQGEISSRSAQEIARLPADVQTAFAISIGSEFLSKESVTYLINRYLDTDTGEQERDRIIHSPKLALPNERKKHRRQRPDCSDSARLSRAIARCLDDVSYLFGLFGRIDRNETAIRISDVTALANQLDALYQQIAVLFPRGENL